MPATKHLTTTTLPAISHDYFMHLAADSGNWSGQPYTDCGNVDGTGRGACITACEDRGLLVHYFAEDGNFVGFTQAGADYAAAHGVTYPVEVTA